MVLKRQCSFCADEIEPGTGTMYVKRDGTVYNFCSSSCRKQLLHLGRVGHRVKWTRAHALKKAADTSSAEARARPTPAKGRPAAGGPKAEEAGTAAPKKPPTRSRKEKTPTPEGTPVPSEASLKPRARNPKAAEP